MIQARCDIPQNSDQIQALLAAIVESSDDAIVSKSLDGIICSWNKGAERIFGYTAEEVIGKHITILFPEDRCHEEEIILSRIARGERVEHFETVRRSKSGQLLDISLTVSPVRAADGRIVGASKIARNITDQKRAARAVALSEERLKDFFENAPLGLHCVDHNGIIIWANAAELRLLGYSADDYVGKHLREIHVNPESVDQILSQLNDDNCVHEFEAKLRCKNGDIKHVRIDSNVYRENGRFVHTRCFTRDITGHKSIEEAIVRQNQQLQTLCRLSDALNRATGVDEMCRLAMEGLIETVHADRAAVLLFENDGVMRFKAWRGLSDEYRAAVEGHSPWKADDADAQPFGVSDVRTDESLAPFRQTIEREGIRGLAFIPLVDSGRVLGKFMVYYNRPHEFTADELTICRAIAANIAFSINRMTSERALRESGARLQLAMHAGKIGVWDWDIINNRVAWTDSLYDIHGLKPGEFGNTVEAFTELVHPDDRAPVQQALQRALNDDDNYELEFRARRPDGETAWIYTNASVLRGDEGRPVRMLGATLDLTQRKKIEHALRESEARFRVLAEVMPQLVWTGRADGSIDYCNARWLEYTGLTLSEVEGDGWAKALHPDDVQPTLVAWKAATGTVSDYQVEQRLRGKDGVYRWFLARALPVKDEEGRIQRWLGTCTDIHEQKMAQDALQRAESRAVAAANRLQRTLSSITDCFISFDKNLRFLDVNQRALDVLFKSSRDQLIGRDFLEVFPNGEQGEFIAHYRRAIEQGVEAHFEAHSTLVDAWFETHAYPREGGLEVYFRDVTKRKNAEQALQESEERYRRLVGLLPVAVYTCDAPSGAITFYNEYAAELWGRAPVLSDLDERFCGSWRLYRSDGSLLPHNETPMAAAIQHGIPSRNQEVTIERPDGSRISVLVNIDPIRDEQGNITGAINVFHDTTALKRAEEALRTSERLYRAIGESINFGIWVCAPDGRNIYASQSFLDLVGITQQQCSDFGWAELLHPDDAEETIASWKRCATGGDFWEREHRFRGKDGQWHHVLARGVPIKDDTGRVVHWAGINLDISELKKAQDTLRTNEAKLRAFYDSAPVLMGVTELWDDKRDVLHSYDNPATCRFFNLNPDETSGKWASEFGVPRDIIDLWIEKFREAERTAAPVRFECHYPKDENCCYLTVTVSCIAQRSNGRTRFCYVAEDITDKKRSEQAVMTAMQREREHAAELAAIMNSAPIPLFVVHDEHCRSITCNDAARQLLQLSPDDDPSLVGIDTHSHHHFSRDGESVAPDDLPIQRAVRLNEPVLNEQLDLVFSDGAETRRLIINVIPLRNHSGECRGAVAAMIDMTEQLKIQAELKMHREKLEDLVVSRTEELERTHQALRLSERMAAMGTLVAGLGHDMGNLLLPVRARLDSLRHASLPTSASEDLVAIRACVEHLQQLASGLRLFALDPDSDTDLRGSADLGTWRREVEPFMRNALLRSIQLHWEIEEGLPEVGLAKHRLTQAIYNLVKNAGDAMQGQPDAAVRIWARRAPDSDFIVIGVDDNGPGMSEEVKRRCLEPFFTTKHRGLSTGLGLSLVHGIAQKCGGRLEIRSEPGAGTSIMVYAPAAIDLCVVSAAQPLAKVCVQDQRIAGFIKTLLSGAGFRLQNGGSPDVAEQAILHIQDWAPELLQQASTILNESASRHLVLLQAPAEVVPNGHSHERLVMLSGPARPVQIREALQPIMREMLKQASQIHRATDIAADRPAWHGR